MEEETKIPQLAVEVAGASESAVELVGVYKLDEGWQKVVDELSKTSKGKRVLKDKEFVSFYWENSLKMHCIDHAVENGMITSDNITANDARSMYYSYPSLISMDSRQSTLQVIAEVGEKEIAELKGREPETYLIRSRRLASVYEELSCIAKDDEAEAFLERAIELNLTVSESSLYLPTSPRKLHAGAAVYDMYFRQKRGELTQDEFNFAQFGYHKELASAFRKTRLSDIDREAVSGSFGELLVLGRARGIAYEAGRLSELDISQSHIRQDSSDAQGAASPSWKWAFDLKIENLSTGELTPVEVKKRTVGSRLTSNVGDYLPMVKVVMFKLGRSKKEYMYIAEKYCEGIAKTYSGESPDPDEYKAIQDFHSKVDEELRELILAA